MPLAGVFPRHISTGRAVARVERVLAVGRAFLTVTAFLAIYIDPTEPKRLQAITYGVLAGYALYSLVVLVYVHRTTRVSARHGKVLHGLDILWTSTLTFVSAGPVSPFYLFFLFVVLAAAYRWAFRETVGTAVMIALVFLIETGIAVAGHWSATWYAPSGLEVNRAIIRVAYLLLTGVLLGYLAQQEKQSRAELAAMADVARQPQVQLGLGGSIIAFARVLCAASGTSSASIVVRDHESRRTLLWHLDQGDAGHAPHARRIELATDQQAAWLFPDSGRTWHASRDGNERWTVRVTEPDLWKLRRDRMSLPPEFVRARSFRTVTAINVGSSQEWHARVYLFDIVEGWVLERRLHLLEALAEHVTPALTNVFLLRRLRARAGAAERARVARELHDGAIQALFGLDMKIEAIRRRSAPAGPTDAELADVQGIVRREILAMRELMQALRPVELDSSDQLPDVLAGLVERFGRDTGIAARFISTGVSASLPPAKAIEMVRIVQEALVNVRKHSHASNVLVRLGNGDGGCRLVIEDDGRGFEFAGRFSAAELDERHTGPVIIKERARVAGAELTIDSTPGSGSRVELVLNDLSHV